MSLVVMEIDPSADNKTEVLHQTSPHGDWNEQPKAHMLNHMHDRLSCAFDVT